MSTFWLVVELLCIGLCFGGDMKTFSLYSFRMILAVLLVHSVNTYAIDVTSTAKALRLSNTITGGTMPVSDPLFAQMVTKVAAGDIEGAANIAATSRYASGYLFRRLALQMQNPGLDASTATDNDATAFLISHFVGTATTSPSLSTIWSENATYMVNDGTTQVHAADLSTTQLLGIDWAASLVQVPGQQAQVMDSSGNIAIGPIPAKHVGGYVTLSDRANDNSFAMYAATAGTNLRMIEGVWEISTGLGLTDVMSSSALASYAPRFVPETDPNFFHGQGQNACLACHGGGMSSVTHGYATVADVFDYDPNNGFTYISAPSTGTMKSYGSDPSKRNATATCNLTKTPMPVCNPDGAAADPNQGWNVGITWQESGVLNTMGWTGPTSGLGLNTLGSAIGQAKIVYQFFTKRVVNEICPMGVFSEADVAAIAAAANPNMQGTDDIRTIVAKVAANASCQ
jgi:hypothetical protein